MSNKPTAPPVDIVCVGVSGVTITFPIEDLSPGARVCVHLDAMPPEADEPVIVEVAAPRPVP